MGAAKFLSRSAYAKSRRRSRQTLQKLIDAGKVPTHGPKQMIDPDEADRAIAENVDPVKGKTAGSSGARFKGKTLGEHRLRREAHTAEIKRMEADRLRGRLVDREDVEREAARAARIARDAWMNWPSRIGPTVAAQIGTDAVKLTQLLEAEVRHQLTDIADQVDA